MYSIVFQDRNISFRKRFNLWNPETVQKVRFTINV